MTAILQSSVRIFPDEGLKQAIDTLAAVDCTAFGAFAVPLAEFLHDFCQRIGDHIVSRGLAAAGANEFELPLGLDLSAREAMLLAAIRTRDIDRAGQLLSPFDGCDGSAADAGGSEVPS